MSLGAGPLSCGCHGLLQVSGGVERDRQSTGNSQKLSDVIVKLKLHLLEFLKETTLFASRFSSLIITKTLSYFVKQHFQKKHHGNNYCKITDEYYLSKRLCIHHGGGYNSATAWGKKSNSAFMLYLHGEALERSGLGSNSR